MKKTPVYIMTKNRPNYFLRMWTSLLHTNTPIEPIIFDDGSDDTAKIKILKNLESVGIRVVWHKEPIKTKRLCLEIMEDAFLNKLLDYCVYVQDDIIFDPDWLNVLFDIEKTIPNLGILTPWDREREVLISGKPKQWEKYAIRNYSQKYGARIGGVCWFVKQEFGLRLLASDPMKNDRFKGFGEDNDFCRMCCEFGFNIAATNPSYVEHFGVKSEAHPEIERTSEYDRCWNPTKNMVDLLGGLAVHD